MANLPSGRVTLFPKNNGAQNVERPCIVEDASPGILLCIASLNPLQIVIFLGLFIPKKAGTGERRATRLSERISILRRCAGRPLLKEGESIQAI
jgi:hypothetical protein